MLLPEFSNLPSYMQNNEVRHYYDVLNCIYHFACYTSDSYDCCRRFDKNRFKRPCFV